MSLDSKHKYSHLAIATGLLALSSGVAHADNFGVEVLNIAEVSYRVGEVETTVQTNEVVFTIVSPVDPNPTIEFFRYSPNAPNPNLVTLNGSEYSPTGNIDGPFISTGEPLNTGTLLNLTGEVPLIPTMSYLSGELMFVRVTNSGANRDSSAIETVIITVEAENGDLIAMRLYESGPDTGEFWAYMQSTDKTTAHHDAVMTAFNNDELTATYEDVIDDPNSSTSGAEIRVVVDTAAVNPNNMVFNSITGEPVNGATVSLLDANTLDFADVYGIDGFSDFPSIVTSGEFTTDEAGLTYIQDDGGFSFPHVSAGNYVVEVVPPEGFDFASALQPDVINANTGAGYFIIDGSYGLPFEMTDIGYIRFDIPLDPDAELVLQKTADRSYGDIGDYINYTVTIQNQGIATAPINLQDTLPVGFRYLEGTSVLDGLHIEDPVVSDDSRLLTYPISSVEPGQSVSLNYALQIGPGAHLGEAINEAIVRTDAGAPLSNIARAGITLREDLLRSHSTIIGRISENSCDGDEDWVRKIERGTGVEGVRLYMETGAYAVSDPDGLYHFEGINEGTHVVQVDEETLPAGYEVMVCEENSRYAGSAHSKFVDIQGGGIWRANFYLKQTGEAVVEAEVQEFVEATDYKNFDQTWLDTQSSDPAWVYPLSDRTPDRSSVNIGIKHPAGGSVELLLNGRPVPKTNRDQGLMSADRMTGLTRFKGVDIRDGKNVFDAIVTGANGQTLATLSEEIYFATNVARAGAVPGKSKLVADGRTVPELAIRLEDEAGRSVHKGRIVTIDVSAPYSLYDQTGERELTEQANDLIAPLSARDDIKVGDNGIAIVRLEPTLQTGKVTVTVTLDTGRQVPLYLYLEPEQRDWIVVGLAEGSLGYETVRDKAISLSNKDSDVFNDGRVAFFAKGLIKGNWLLTLQVDTDKRRGGRDGDFAAEIDPNAYYSLYGDRSHQYLETSSRYPLYVKLEKKSAYALFGDFNTDITEGRLTSYNRHFSGLKAEYVDETIQAQGFVAETNQGFGKDEIPADGTSGTYQLSHRNILAQSETIVIETRDRNRPDVILERKELIRYLDYTLDYLTGQIIFRLPVDVSDAQFNPNVIVVDYETAEDAERNITAGGRVQVTHGDIRVGSSFVHQEGSGSTAGAESNMVGIDVVAQINDNIEARAEYAITENKIAGQGSTTSDAKLAEIIHTSEKVSAHAYYREEEAGYGVGQINSNTAGFRRYGVEAKVRVNQFENEETGKRGSQTVDAAAYHQDNLNTGDSRETAEVMFNHNGSKLTFGGGLRASRDDLSNGTERESLLAVASASLRVPDLGATFQISHEQPLNGKDEVTNYPQRTIVGVNKTIGSKASVTLRHEILDGALNESQNTVIGVNLAPWDGTSINASSDLVTNDSGRRLGGTFGLDQQVRLDKNVSASIGVTSRKVLDEDIEYIDVAADGPISPLETNQNFNAAYVGMAYNNDNTTVSGRLETRMSSASDTWIASVGAARELSEEISLAASVRSVWTDPNNVVRGDHERIDGRVGLAWRPRGEETVVFDRLDVSHETNELGQTRTKIVNNLAANTMIDDNWQLSAHYGAKYVSEEIAGQSFSDFTHLVGAETRFDVTERIDLGLHGSILTNGDSFEYSFGPSVGFSPIDDVWISAGYNVEGFKDDDFEAAEYKRDGLYFKLRIKFDQDTARGLLKRISPTQEIVGTQNVNPKSFATP
ncbi:MAG: DUF11 domain-containing protein [Hellea sp.]|nr:DUF11 domain-containing protein [Hellea sp.]